MLMVQHSHVIIILDLEFRIHDSELAEITKIATKERSHSLECCVEDVETRQTIPISIIGKFSCIFGKIAYLNLTKCKNLVVIDEFAFARCYSLIRVKFPSSLQHIKKYAFMECENLRKVVFPKKSKIISLGYKSFSQCSMLSVFVCPKSLQYIERECFDTFNMDIIFNDNIKILGKNNIFSGSLKRKFIPFPKNLRIMEAQLSYFYSEKNYIFPLNITQFNFKDFNFEKAEIKFYEDDREKRIVKSYDTNLYNTTGSTLLFVQKKAKYFTIRADIEKIFQFAFYFGSIRVVKIPDSVKEVCKYAFSECNFLKNVRFGVDSRLEILRKESFSKCVSLRMIKLPKSLKIIEKYVFIFCKKLRKIVFPNDSKLYSIGKKAFSYTKIANISFPNSLVDMHPEALLSIKSLKEIKINNDSLSYQNKCLIDQRLKRVNNVFGEIDEIPKGIEIIGKILFEGKKLHIPSSVRVFGDECFMMAQISSITFEEDSRLEEIGFHSFIGSKINKLVLPPSIKKIHLEAFCNNNFDELIINNNFFSTLDDGTVIGLDPPSIVFSKSKSIDLQKIRPKRIHASSLMKLEIDKLIIPNSVEEIGHFAFSESKIKEVLFEDDSKIEKIQFGIFESCLMLTKIYFSPSVKEIESEICMGCDNLKEVYFPMNSQIEEIGKYAFNGSELTRITFPAKILPSILPLFVDDSVEFVIL